MLSCCLVTSRLNSEHSYLSYRDRKWSLKRKLFARDTRFVFELELRSFSSLVVFFFGFFFSILPHCPLSLNSWLQNDLLVLLTGCVSWIQTPSSYSRKNFGTNSVPVCFPSLPWPGCHLLCRGLHLCPSSSWYITWQLQAHCLGLTRRTYLICSLGLFLSKHQSIE